MADDVVVIRPSRGWQPLALGRLWEFRELGAFFVWRELKLRYKQTLLGVAWSVLQPALTAGVFAIVFGRLARISSDGAPYFLFAFAGLVPWFFCSQTVSQAARGLGKDAQLVSRVYFPRLLLPLGTVLSFLVDLALATLILLGIAIGYGRTPGAVLLALPLFAALLLATALAASFLLSALNAQYRDVQYLLPFLLQLWLFASPIVYPLSLVPDAWQPVAALNPLVTVVEGFRWATAGGPAPALAIVAVSTASAIAALLASALYFRRMERAFADVL